MGGGWKIAANKRKLTHDDYTTPINLKCCSISHRLSVIRRGVFEIANFWEFMECYWIGMCTNRKPTHEFQMPFSIQRFCSNSRRLSGIPMSNHGLNSAPRLGLGRICGGRGAKMIPIEISSPHSYSTLYSL